MRLLSSIVLVILSCMCLGNISVYGQNNSITMSLGTVTANCGDQVCINVTTQDFNNVLTFQYSMTVSYTHLTLPTIYSV